MIAKPLQMKILTLILLFFSFNSLGQENLSVELKYSNELNGGITVHTLATNFLEKKITEDSQVENIENEQITKLLNEIRDLEGVTRATYDGSTGLITVLSNSTNEFNVLVVELNKKLLSNEF